MLFQCRNARRLGETIATVIPNSLGALRLEVTLGGQMLVGSNTDAASSLAGDGHLWEWRNGSALVELVICWPTLSMPDHLTVDDCWSALYRVEVTQDVRDVAFSCTWESGYRWTDWDYDGGEGHLGWAYDDGHNVVSVSTEDELFMSYRAERGDWLPRRLLRTVDYYSPGFNPDLIELSARGIDVRLPPLLTGERVQIQFTVAWGMLSPGAPTTWCVAALRPSDILAGAGCD